jgi:hypothetical protein
VVRGCHGWLGSSVLKLLCVLLLPGRVTARVVLLTDGSISGVSHTLGCDMAAVKAGTQSDNQIYALHHPSFLGLVRAFFSVLCSEGSSRAEKHGVSN